MRGKRLGPNALGPTNSQLTDLLAGLRRRVLLFFHFRLGRLQLRRGNLARAREHFLLVLQHDHRSFAAHVALGEVYLRQERFPLAYEEFQKARELDPRQFRREHLLADPLLGSFERAAEARRQQSLRTAITNREGSRVAADTESVSPFESSEDVETLPFGDFSSRDEAERFAVLPPLSLVDSEEIDWDRLGRELTEGP